MQYTLSLIKTNLRTQGKLLGTKNSLYMSVKYFKQRIHAPSRKWNGHETIQQIFAPIT